LYPSSEKMLWRFGYFPDFGFRSKNAEVFEIIGKM
jgi:hypothetical protein